METSMIDVFMTGKKRTPVTFIKRGERGTCRGHKDYHVFPSSLSRLAVWCRHSSNAGTGKVIPFFNGWAWMKKEVATH